MKKIVILFVILFSFVSIVLSGCNDNKINYYFYFTQSSYTSAVGETIDILSLNHSTNLDKFDNLEINVKNTNIAEVKENLLITKEKGKTDINVIINKENVVIASKFQLIVSENDECSLHFTYSSNEGVEGKFISISILKENISYTNFKFEVLNNIDKNLFKITSILNYINIILKDDNFSLQIKVTDLNDKTYKIITINQNT